MKLISVVCTSIVLASCARQTLSLNPRPEHGIGFYDQEQRLRLSFELPPEFTIAETIGCEEPLKLNGILCCGNRAKGSPVSSGYFKGEQHGLIVSGWINFVDPILSPESVLRTFTREGKVHVLSQKMTKINEHEATLADLDVTFMKPESVNRHEQWLLFKVDGMAGAITFKEYAGNEIRLNDPVKSGLYETQGVPYENWQLNSVIENIIKSAKIYLPN